MVFYWGNNLAVYNIFSFRRSSEKKAIERKRIEAELLYNAYLHRCYPPYTYGMGMKVGVVSVNSDEKLLLPGI